MKTQNVVVDIGNLKASDIFFVQGEQGREITFKVINSLLEDFVNLAGYTATIHILKSDGNFTIDTMTIDSAKSECYYTLTENDCACGGRGFYDLSFSKNDELIYTAHGDFVGDFRSVNDDSVNSVSIAYGVTFPEGFQQKLIAGDKIHISDDNVISAEGEIYTAGDNINISDDNVISATDTKYVAGDNIEINENNVISAIIPSVFTQTKLWDYVEDNSNIVPFGLYNETLSDSINNYDELIIELISISSDLSDPTWLGSYQFGVNINAVKNAYNPYYFIIESAVGRTSKFYINGTTFQKVVDASGNINGLARVYGIKY